MIDFSNCFRDMKHVEQLNLWVNHFKQKISVALGQKHGNFPIWMDAVAQLPPVRPKQIRLDTDTIQLGEALEFDDTQIQSMKDQLRKLHPWRKGPFSIGKLKIDTEWRSDLKWQRVQPYIAPLKDRVVLDIGCGSGYHCLRMFGDGAKLVIGIDPMLLYVAQFSAIKHFTGDIPVHVLPLNVDGLPEMMPVFDTVFSMGVLYHRRSPIDHLLHLKNLLRSGGEVVLETLVIEGDENAVLVPDDRYAKMRNVWFIPSTAALNKWLIRAGFRDVRLVDTTKTTSKEQRKTDWMTFESLDDFLDPNDANRTVEGYPAPIRAVFVATAP